MIVTDEAVCSMSNLSRLPIIPNTRNPQAGASYLAESSIAADNTISHHKMSYRDLPARTNPLSRKQ